MISAIIVACQVHHIFDVATSYYYLSRRRAESLISTQMAVNLRI
jgi:hypothetical protein